ncbi:MAG TPA: isoprenylcysteine carboxylmethyltransferase family protein [Xanthobacteraceae bacterium]|jgi:protein-S-isoprenylcysteine O-methyltransferase Ste14
MVLRLIIRTAIWIAVMAVLLFLPAGTLRWAAGWIFLAESGGFGLAIGLWLARHDPALLAERMSMLVQPAQKRWDKAFMAAIVPLWAAWLALMALDAVRWRSSHVPAALQAIGAVLIALCMYLAYLVLRENSFAAPVVKVATERGHRVVDSGPYAHVRHPMYAGALLFFIGTPLLLGSWWGLAVAAVLAAVLAVRAVLEERTLAHELPGYREYVRRVRYRFVPGIW